ncbi:MAG: FAD-dependent oxidoreductase [Kiritimatiellae bacterium]|nr:FAD-dependent oxidoreductase [Kiritimatiellia bacterium]
MKNVKTDCLIMGNSTAAIAAVEGIRSLDGKSSITIASRERRRAYSRPLISALLSGGMDGEKMYYRSEEFYADHNVRLKLGAEIVRVDAQKHLAWTAGNGAIEFGKFLIASGSRPFIPPIEGVKARGIFTHMDWDGAQAAADYIADNNINGREKSRAVVIGGGLIGLKAAEALRRRGLNVVVVEMAERLLASCLNARAAGIIGETMEAAGVEIMCGETMERILEKDGAADGVRLKKGGEIPARLVLIAAGAVPNVDIFRETEMKIDRGILIDEYCRASVPDIYAAGDAAQYRDTISGRSCVIPIFANAFSQGRTAGINMAGGRAAIMHNFAMNSAEIFGLPLVALGLSAAAPANAEVLEKTGRNERAYKRFVLDNNRIVGAIFAGDIDRAGIIAGIMRRKLDIGGIRDLLLTNEFGLLSLPAEYRKCVAAGEGIEV